MKLHLVLLSLSLLIQANAQLQPHPPALADSKCTGMNQCYLCINCGTSYGEIMKCPCHWKCAVRSHVDHPSATTRRCLNPALYEYMDKNEDGCYFDHAGHTICFCDGELCNGQGTGKDEDEGDENRGYVTIGTTTWHWAALIGLIGGGIFCIILFLILIWFLAKCCAACCCKGDGGSSGSGGYASQSGGGNPAPARSNARVQEGDRIYAHAADRIAAKRRDEERRGIVRTDESQQPLLEN